MSRFTDLLNKPLPSAKYVTESEDPAKSIEDAAKKAEAMKKTGSDMMKSAVSEDGDEIYTPTCPTCDDDSCPECEDDDNDTTPDPVDVSLIKKQVNPADPTDAFIADDEGTDGEADQRINDDIQRVATPMLMGDSFSDEEIKDFTESVDADIAIDEDFFTERTIVKFDKKSRFNQLKKVAVLAIAKEKKDPLYKKLKTAWAIEKTIEQKLEAKYSSQATSRANMYLKKAKMSKSNAVKKVAKKVK